MGQYGCVSLEPQAQRARPSLPHPHPSSSPGLTRGSPCAGEATSAGVGPQDPRVKPAGDDRGAGVEVGAARRGNPHIVPAHKNLSPPSAFPPYSPSRARSTDACATNAWRGRFGFLMGRCGKGPKRTDGRMWIKGGIGALTTSSLSLPRRTGETRRGSEVIGNNQLNNPQPENAAISPKSRAHGAMIASY